MSVGGPILIRRWHRGGVAAEIERKTETPPENKRAQRTRGEGRANRKIITPRETYLQVPISSSFSLQILRFRVFEDFPYHGSKVL
ncbi:hypothetical protein Nepgr_021903 [Nepenthes gracilis]|uniref:Uncharacterized protein n=1 Tax=Nepenthes gracilis TaxID=150966 RepID=A0AAD3SZR7_NEPGR|nr:hypothetical protein Nepgr_021903 [Nepenthes gracilis]